MIIRRIFLILSALILLSLTLFLLFSYFKNYNNFPAPTGTYGVGKLSYHLIDNNRQEPNNPGFPRELMIYFYYPTDLQSASPQTPYDADALSSAQQFLSEQSGLPHFLFAGMRNIKTFAQNSAPISHKESSYPVIIISHGSGTMLQQYTWICEELASHGYCVVGINHTYMASVTHFPDNRRIFSLAGEKKKAANQEAELWRQVQLELNIGDVQFVLDSLATFNDQPSFPLYQKLDLGHIGIAGHSYGGHIAMRTALQDHRIKACLNMDGALRSADENAQFFSPCLMLLGKKSHVWKKDPQERDKLFSMQKNQDMPIAIITFNNVGHGILTDLPLLLESTLFTGLSSYVMKTDMQASAHEGYCTISRAKKYIVDFFDAYLKDTHNSISDASIACDGCGIIQHRKVHCLKSTIMLSLNCLNYFQILPSHEVL